MNCKQGDLAIVVAAPNDPHYLGKIVRCVNLRFFEDCVCWETDPPMVWTDSHGVTRPLPWDDRDLRPIRDLPGEDETLSWEIKPELATA
jgi:hypothetical protein